MSWSNTIKYISCGTQTLSKKPSMFVEGVYPTYIERGFESWVWGNDGKRYIDYPLGLGTILLGHCNKDVSNAVKSQIDLGTIFTLPSYLETELAEKIVSIIPSAEKVRFLKTGSEATSAAVKIARAHTNKPHIAYCGYHGWHDWYTIATEKSDGIPWGYSQLITKFEYNNIESLRDILIRGDVGCVIMEPYIYAPPKDDFLNKVIELAHEYGAVVVFDEIVTGFRTKEYSAQAMFNATPDISCFGKGMANGYPLSVVCGKTDIMEVLEDDCFVSSTFGGELLSIVAALEVIRILEDKDVIEYIWEQGEKLILGYNGTARELGIDTECIGYPCRTMFMFPTGDHKSLFWQECIKRGVLFGYAQFIAYSHGNYEIEYTNNVIRQALEVVKKHWDNPLAALQGKPAKAVFRLVK